MATPESINVNLYSLASYYVEPLDVYKRQSP